jgi:succinylglutamate desuccinylase
MQERKAVLHGEVVLLRGNTRALEQRVRYIDADLNRQWTIENARTAALEKQGIPEVSELREQSEVLAIVKEVVSRARGEIYFLDLHTTSAHGQPFATASSSRSTQRKRLDYQHPCRADSALTGVSPFRVPQIALD